MQVESASNTYLISPWSRVLLEKLTASQLVKKSPAFYGTRRFITAFTSARHLSLSWAKVSVQVRGLMFSYFITMCVFTARSCYNLAEPQAGGPPLVGCPLLLTQYIRSYPPYWRPFLHPQPEDAPCPGDRDTLIFFQSSCKLLPDYKVSRHSRPQSASLVMISKGIWATQAVVINYM